MSIVWSKDFSIKNLELDKQHQIIFDITNEAYELAKRANEENLSKEDEAQIKEELKGLIYRIFEYMKVHFKDEEKYMKDLEFPLLEEHIKQHRELISKTKELLYLGADLKNFATEFKNFTTGWILEHFVNGDAWITNYKYKAFHVSEIHCSLESYKKLHNMKQDLNSQKHFTYICACKLKLTHIAQSIHDELLQKETVLKCDDCGQILVFLQDEIDEDSGNFASLKKELEELSIWVRN